MSSIEIHVTRVTASRLAYEDPKELDNGVFVCAECFEFINKPFGVTRGKADTCDTCGKQVGYQCRLLFKSSDLLLVEAALAMKEFTCTRS